MEIRVFKSLSVNIEFNTKLQPVTIYYLESSFPSEDYSLFAKASIRYFMHHMNWFESISNTNKKVTKMLNKGYVFGIGKGRRKGFNYIPQFYDN